MRINLVYEDFYPSTTAVAKRAISVANFFSMSASVNMFCLADEDKVEKHGAVTVFFIKSIDCRDKNSIGRLLSELVNAYRLYRREKEEVATMTIVSTPFMGMLLVFGFLKSRKRNYVLEVRDLIWNYFEYKTGFLNGVISKFLKFICFSSIRRFKRAVVLTKGQYEEVSRLCEAVHIIPNGLSKKLFSEIQTHRMVEPAGERVITYAGTVGYPQNLEVFLMAAERCQGKSDFVFSVCGSGREYDRLKLKYENLQNVEFLGRLDLESLLDQYARSYYLYAQLRDSPVYNTAEPTKFFEYAATGRKMILGFSGNAKELASEFEYVQFVQPDSVNDIVEFLLNANHSDYEKIESNISRIESNYIRENIISGYGVFL